MITIMIIITTLFTLKNYSVSTVIKAGLNPCVAINALYNFYLYK